MRQQQHIASCQETYLTVRGLTPEKVIYFDIETTGFRASTSQLYMIGWAVKLCPEDADTWMITQLLAETAAEEALILQQFLDVLKDYDTIVEFNGDRFDLPYLREKCASHQMGDPFEGLQTVDLYQEIRPCKSMLGMSRLNQKSVEQFLQISRKDPYNGGELIQVYREVRNRTAEDMEASVSALFLHNYEDVLGMLAMTPIVSYPLICAGDEPVCCRILNMDGNVLHPSSKPCDPGTVDPAGVCCLEASYTIPVCVPTDLCTDMGAWKIKVQGSSVTVTIPLFHGTLYHFFPDYKEYYYLPEEDTAMHKSVACFVDPSHRRKATAQNCYVKKEGTFLPQTDERFLPSFRSSFKDPLSWFEYQPRLLEDTDALTSYVHSLVRSLSN